MLKPIFFYLSVVLLMFALIDITFEWQRKIYLLYGLLLIFGVLSIDSMVKQTICTQQEVIVPSVKQMCDHIQPGDLIGFLNKKAYKWWENILISCLAESYLHHAVVLEHNGAKYVYHGYTTPVQDKRIQDGFSSTEYTVGKVLNWEILLEPLESYLNYMKPYNTGIRILRSGVSQTYSSEINQQVINSLERRNILTCHCCIIVGEYISHIHGSTPFNVPYYVNQTIVYTPISLKNIYPIKETLYYRVG